MCGHWNKVAVDKILVQPTAEQKVKAYMPMYGPLRLSECKKCEEVIAKPKELIRIVKNNVQVC